MIQPFALRSFLTVVFLTGIALAADPLKSGPPVGQELPGTFEPVNINGPDAGRKTCIFCEYEDHPVVLVFARSASEPLACLTKRLDAATSQHKASKLHSSVIWLNNDAGLAKELKQLADKGEIEHTLLRTYKPEGPKGYELSKDADVIVVLFTDRVVKANHAFRKGELGDQAIDAVVADIAKILPDKK